MAPDKQHAHQLLEQLDSSQLAAVVQLLEVMTDPLARSLANAAVDDALKKPQRLMRRTPLSDAAKEFRTRISGANSA